MEGEINSNGAVLKLAAHVFNNIKEGVVMCLLLFYITYFIFFFLHSHLIIYSAPWGEEGWVERDLQGFEACPKPQAKLFIQEG